MRVFRPVQPRFGGALGCVVVALVFVLLCVFAYVLPGHYEESTRKLQHAMKFSDRSIHNAIQRRIAYI